MALCLARAWWRRMALASNLGDDADTTAAICGQVAGAYYGQPGIPVPWQVKLHLKDRIIELGERLAG